MQIMCTNLIRQSLFAGNFCAHPRNAQFNTSRTF